ncbi:MAG TPA: amino acid adenylation domain-containing protein, partial [Thermoanaerobaculia bacterium]|nr:amino acid adenylation domain-containing protein [Thermoanaerobaculia bacterium]
YRGLLDQAVADPGAAISRYTLLTPEAVAVLPDPAAELAVRWPGAAHELVAEQARLRPDHPALVDRDGAWTYAELDLAARQLAARLLAGGIEPGDRVAIYAHRSAALAWAVLGVMRAGAVFVLLDPAVPAPRLVEVLRLAGPRGWLRLEAAGPLPETLEQSSFVCRLDLPGTPLLEGPLPESWPVVGPDAPACISFTSGSTGEPKGILQTHGGMTGFLPWHEETLGYGPSDRHTMLSGLAHDPLQRDLFYCLGSGGTLCVPDPNRIGEPGWLAGWMRRERVTVTNLTPAMAQLLTESAGTTDLRCAVLGGDVLTRSDIERLRRLAPHAAVVNVYGSTESHRALSFHFVEEEDRDRQVVPLGIGQPGSQLLVLTRGGLQAGVGELGEIAIRSPRLAAGYWQDEALTRERFVADRYRTGDLGRYLPNGEVEVAGRADQQVKVRGYRVEPGEVEAELYRLPGVREAAVAGRDDGHGGRRLVAWVVLDPAASPGGLRDRLRERLPAYMVPSVFVEMEKLPLNLSGKVDRRALPETGPVSEREKVAPRDVLELRLARVWEEVLGLTSIGVTESFFDLGGHSLLAVGLTARIARDFGRTLPLAALFQAPTVAELAALLREGAVEDAALVPLQVGGSRPPLFLVHPVGGQVFSYVELARLLGPDQPVYALQDVAPPDAPRSLASLASRYLCEVRAVQPTGPYLLAGWSFGGRVAWEMSRQLDAAGEEVAFLGMIDTGLVAPPARLDVDDAALLAEVIGDLPLTVEELRREADPLAALIERAREAGTLPPGTTPEMAHHLLAVLKAHLEVARTDRPHPYHGKLTF